MLREPKTIINFLNFIKSPNLITLEEFKKFCLANGNRSRAPIALVVYQHVNLLALPQEVVANCLLEINNQTLNKYYLKQIFKNKSPKKIKIDNQIAFFDAINDESLFKALSELNSNKFTNLSIMVLEGIFSSDLSFKSSEQTQNEVLHALERIPRGDTHGIIYKVFKFFQFSENQKHTDKISELFKSVNFIDLLSGDTLKITENQAIVIFSRSFSNHVGDISPKNRDIILSKAKEKYGDVVASEIEKMLTFRELHGS